MTYSKWQPRFFFKVGKKSKNFNWFKTINSIAIQLQWAALLKNKGKKGYYLRKLNKNDIGRKVWVSHHVEKEDTKYGYYENRNKKSTTFTYKQWNVLGKTVNTFKKYSIWAISHLSCTLKIKFKSVACSSQRSHTGQLDFCNWLADSSTMG